MSLRDLLWDYPVILKKTYISLIPLSHIFLFTLISVGVFTFLFSPVFAKYLVNSENTRFVEGVVGGIDRLNPLYVSSNQVDRDVQELIFTKFIEIDAQGNPVPSLATSWDVTGDSKVYTFKLRNDMKWHDGKSVTADDVVFTFNFAKELYNQYSVDTFGSSIETVSFEKVNDFTVRFVLSEVNATFFETIAVYVVPKHVLNNTKLESYAFEQFNQNPLGSGPFYVQKNDTTGLLLARSPYYPEKVNLSFFEFRFYPTLEELEFAFRSNLLDGVGVYDRDDVPFVNEYKEKFSQHTFDLPYRKKIIFFNTRDAKFANAPIRRGLGYLLDKGRMISELGLDAKVSDSPLPSNSWAYLSNLDYIKYNPKNAEIELKLVGYTKSATNGFYTSSDGKILSVSITYLENEFNQRIVDWMSEQYEKEGVLLNPVPKTYEQITKEVLASRDFELILYEMEISVDPDQYNIWHSLKIDYPNLNISGYKFTRVDVYLERGRQVLNRNTRVENYENFQKVLLNDAPGIFLFEPKFTYIIRTDVEGFDGTSVQSPQQRFSNVTNWIIR